MTTDARRDRRYRVRLPAKLVRGNEQVALVAHDVSYRGVFLRTETPPELRQLLRIQMALPPAMEVVSLHAMAVFVVLPGLGRRAPGVGVQFYAMDPLTRARWEAFVRHVQASGPVSEAADEAILAVSPDSDDPGRRRFEGRRAELYVQLRTVEELYELLAAEVSVGGMFIRTTLDLEPGEEVDLHVVHPKTDAVFPIAGVVRRRVREAGFTGVGVEFMAMNDPLRHELDAFVASGLTVPEGAGDIFIDEDDPKLD